MVKYISKLTKEQEEMMPQWVEKWIRIGLKTGKTDWKTFDRYMPVYYKKAGLKYPKRIVRVSSPLVGALASSIAGKILNSGAVGDAVVDAVSGAVDDAVRGAVDGAVRDAVDDAVVGAVRGAVDGAVSGAVSDAVRDAVGDAVVGAKLSWHNWLGGQFWVGWYWYISPSVVSFFTDVCKLKLNKDITERAEAYRKICESVNYIWANKDFVMVCARPKKINRDNEGMLHSEAGKSIEYPDGWGLYNIHGVRFGEALYWGIIKKTIKPRDVFKIKNTEQRAIAVNMTIDDRAVKELGAIEIDKKKYCYGTDYLIELKKMKDGLGKPYKFIKGYDPAEKGYVYVRVNPKSKTVQEAHDLSYRLKLFNLNYNPDLRT